MKTFFDQYKIINLVFFTVIVVVWLLINNYYSLSICLDNNCSFEFRNGFLNPVQVGALFLLPTLSLFLVLPSHYFRRWLLYVASWALPISLYLVVSESVYTTALFSGRTFFAEMTMRAVFVISLIFVIGTYIYTHYLKR